ncbi:MAG: hypothetical protein OXB98_14700 [Bryobacterales bacterium]|nr:hypothetical protein [Bryobacterales bacterium]
MKYIRYSEESTDSVGVKMIERQHLNQFRFSEFVMRPTVREFLVLGDG